MNSPTGLNGWRQDLEEYASNFNMQLGLASMIGLQVMPEFVFPKAHGRYASADRDQARRKHIIRHTSGGGFTRIATTMGSGTFDCEDFGLEMVADKKRRSEYKDPIDWQSEDAQVMDFNIRLGHEIRVADTVTDTSVFTLNNPAKEVAWSLATRATMDPKLDIDAAYNAMRGKCQFPRSEATLVVPYARWLDLAQCTKILDAVKYTTVDLALGAEAVKKQLIAQYLEIKQIVVGQSQYISSPQDADTTTYTEVWPENTLILTNLAPAGAQKLYPCIGRTVRWDGDNGDLPSFVTMDTYRIDETDEDVTRARQYTDEFVRAVAGEGVYHIDASNSQ